MPSYLAVYEDSAPFFTYSGPWRAGSSDGDAMADKYSESSFFLTEALGASMSFTFYGTEVTILGAKRPNHGRYSASIDGVDSPILSGAGEDQFLATLYTATAAKGLHNVTLTNRDPTFLDVDQVSWLASVGQDNEPLIVNNRQDSHPDFVYTPSDAWTSSPPSVGTFSGGTGRGTSQAGASARLTFKGDAVALYGPCGPAIASSYSVQVNNNPPTLHSALKQFYRPRQLLYYGANLGKGTHTVTIRLEATSDRSEMLAIDYAEVFTTPSLGGSFDSTISTPAGLIAGLAVLAVITSICLGILAYIFLLYKRKRFNFAPAPKTGDSDVLAEGYTGPGFQPAVSPFVAYSQYTTRGLQYGPSMSMPSAGPSTTAQYAPSDGPSSANSLLNPRVAPSAPQMRYATTNGSSSLAYYQPSDAGDSGVRDGRSTGAASVSTAISTSTSTGTSTNPSLASAFPSRPIRNLKSREAASMEQEAPLPTPPPPAYNPGSPGMSS